MTAINYTCAVANDFERSFDAVVCRNSGKAPLDWERCQCEKKPIPARILLTLTFKPLPTYRGFFIAARYEYGRDNQPNDIAGSATRTYAGGNGGRIIEPAWEQSSLLGQAFVPTVQGLQKSVIAKARDGSVKDTRKGKRKTMLNGYGMSFAFRSGFTVKDMQ